MRIGAVLGLSVSYGSIFVSALNVRDELRPVVLIEMEKYRALKFSCAFVHGVDSFSRTLFAADRQFPGSRLRVRRKVLKRDAITAVDQRAAHAKADFNAHKGCSPLHHHPTARVRSSVLWLVACGDLVPEVRAR